ncbi:serine acetyltransferase [Collibacillus ludicampi]|uniref:Serine acetyltransferase n=1 Tax=Collibacillus ludicampi TaxID=2771369 RepID=A0AAV4LL41_9BACL|nr:serine O-acetyltransferase EpsC [Collibacillus ludicampi]GIM48042.1 serine acetyltransferase [Collibacillus ludicampi]
MVERVFKSFADVANQLCEGYQNHSALQGQSRIFPNRKHVIQSLEDMQGILLPGYYSDEIHHAVSLIERLGSLQWSLSRQLHDSVPHDCPQGKCETFFCEVFQHAFSDAIQLIEKLPAIREILNTDVQAAFRGDPAAKNYDEIILSYPGILAIMTHRIAHEIFKLGYHMIARIMSEHAHSLTGIDIHPGATIGRYFFIDHGTGVVIGETCVIGDNVKVYQGVTLGALSFQRDMDGNIIRDSKKRHPTIEDDVTIYSGATILGGDTVIGRGSVIGGNVWLTKSVPPGSKVITKPEIQMFTSEI